MIVKGMGLLSFSGLFGAGLAYSQGVAPGQCVPPLQAAAPSVGDLPPNPKSGECYARVITPAKYEEKTENIVVREASQKMRSVSTAYLMLPLLKNDSSRGPFPCS